MYWHSRSRASVGLVTRPATLRPRRSSGAEYTRPRGKISARISAARARLGKLRRKRSEEHTSELQSRVDLVCRLLLEKKKKNNKPTENKTTLRTASAYPVIGRLSTCAT